MKRSIVGFIAGFVVWALVATVINRGLRAGFPGYTAAERALTFTLGMKAARLLMAALASLAAGATIAMIAPLRRGLPWLLGAIILALFIPSHIYLWAKFPIWYHLTFLLTLVPLVALGAALGRGRSRTAPRQISVA